MTTTEPRNTTPPAANRDDETYLDFAEGLRSFTQRAVAPLLQDASDRALAAYEQAHGAPPRDVAEVRDALNPVPVIAARNRLMRSSQEMKWVGIRETLHAQEAELLAGLDEADRIGPGSVTWDPNFPYPEYFSTSRFHLQPGGYFTDPLAGYMYHYGTKVFFTGRNNKDDVQRQLIDQLPLPADGQIRRVLDLGCSAGQSATAFKERFPQAEVWGIDISAPMVRYSHRRAIDLGVEVHFAQQRAEQTSFADNSFDVVFAFILFHELPLEIQKQVCREACRVLRPGGYFAIADFPNRPSNSTNSLADYVRYFDTHYNGERYASEFVYSDFPGNLKAAGFSKVDPNGVPGSWLPIRIATK